MKEILNELEKLNDKFRTTLKANDFVQQFNSLSEVEKEKFLIALSVSVNNAKILTNKLLNDGRKK